MQEFTVTQNELTTAIAEFYKMVMDSQAEEPTELNDKKDLKTLSSLLLDELNKKNPNLDLATEFISQNFTNNNNLKARLSAKLEATKEYYKSMLPRVDDWINKIGNYELPPEKGKVENLLTRPEARHELYAKTNSEESKIARTRFLIGLYRRFLELKETKNQPKNTIKMDALLGLGGIQAYQEAIAEEAKSQSFRDAVFLSSAQHYGGPTWNKNLILWVGGPSASGKTYAAGTAVKAISQLMDTTEGINFGNNVVSVDGAVEREVSQIRQLALQVALSKGYKGIQDLHKTTELNIKGYIKNAALAQGNLSLVIPETFAESRKKTLNIFNFLKSDENNPILKINEMTKYNTMQEEGKVVQAFAEVTCDKNRETSFRIAIFHMGTTRAWLDKEFEKSNIKINNRNIGCESKAYKYLGFYLGKNASAAARSFLKDKNPDLIQLEIMSDLIFVKKDKNMGWQEWIEKKETPTDNAPIFKLSNRDFIKWKQEKDSRGNNALDLPQWYEEQKLQGKLAEADITIITKERKYKYKPIEENKSELKGKEPEETLSSHNKESDPIVKLTKSTAQPQDDNSSNKDLIHEEKLIQTTVSFKEEENKLKERNEKNEEEMQPYGASTDMLAKLNQFKDSASSDGKKIDIEALLKSSQPTYIPSSPPREEKPQTLSASVSNQEEKNSSPNPEASSKSNNEASPSPKNKL